MMDAVLLRIRRERAEHLAAALEAETGLPAGLLLGRSRDRAVTTLRRRLWTMLFDSGLSISQVAQVVERDHSSVIQALRKHMGAEQYASALLQHKVDFR